MTSNAARGDRSGEKAATKAVPSRKRKADHEPMMDGIQILRYFPGQAYISHTDWFALSQSSDHNWKASDGGSNRFATIFLYLNDVDEGGQTVFPYLKKDHT